MEFKSAFFALMIFSMVMVASSVIIDGWNTKYEAGLDNDLGEYDKQSEIQAQAETQRGQVSASDEGVSGDFETNTFRGVYSIITNIFAPFNIAINMLTSVGERFKIPSYVTTGIITMIIFAVVFSIIAIIFRLSRRSA